jgi:hypothetical protein
VWTAVVQDLGPWRTLTTLLAPAGRGRRPDRGGPVSRRG